MNLPPGVDAPGGFKAAALPRTQYPLSVRMMQHDASAELTDSRNARRD